MRDQCVSQISRAFLGLKAFLVTFFPLNNTTGPQTLNALNYNPV